MKLKGRKKVSAILFFMCIWRSDEKSKKNGEEYVGIARLRRRKTYNKSRH